MNRVFLALAIWGAVHPMYHFIGWFMANGWNLGAMIDAWYVNQATTALTWDLTIAAIALTVWALAETRQTGERRRLWAIPATFCIGVSCGLPLYLYLRSRD
ncbi:DUF2834 domain-containing protein [Pseudoprimorskyibacter insulae]|uniref:K+-transporting ATPase, A chain n=1 Tax=Pseudoprimorskyibacter insulae TaxID=1695997 RepID=A0A2R8AUS0_9RHOB|nr:DUF2834 domain-containing protein [Pseudoprimorskyibacter insulae]SPF79805.1 hypothetical protein PRI8871_01603 [Pseudoprimorskyibacter insulae]